MKNQKRELIGNLGTLNAHTRYLEEWSPDVQEDAYRWVPTGLYYDLVDDGIGLESVSGITDDVNYFTNQNLWQAMIQNSPLTVSTFKNNLNQMRPANVTTTNSLFDQYD